MESFDDRKLCPDGGCIGVLSDSGVCPECGRSASGELTSPIPVDRATEDAPFAATGDEFDDRLLCSDGNCIGVCGANGRCHECGKLCHPADIGALSGSPDPG